MFAGVDINSTGGPGGAARGAAYAREETLIVDGQNVVSDVHAVLRRMGDLFRPYPATDSGWVPPGNGSAP